MSDQWIAVLSQCIPAFSATCNAYLPSRPHGASVIWDIRLAHTCPHSQWKFWSHFLVPHSHVATVLPLYATSIESRALMVSHKTCAIQQVLAAPLPQPVAKVEFDYAVHTWCDFSALRQHSQPSIIPSCLIGIFELLEVMRWPQQFWHAIEWKKSLDNSKLLPITSVNCKLFQIRSIEVSILLSKFKFQAQKQHRVLYWCRHHCNSGSVQLKRKARWASHQHMHLFLGFQTFFGGCTQRCVSSLRG